MLTHVCTAVLCLPLLGQTGERGALEEPLFIGGPQAGALVLSMRQDLVDLALPAREATPNRHPRRRAKREQALTFGLITAALLLTDQETHDLIGTHGDGSDADIAEWVETFGRESGAASVVGLYLLGDDYDKETAKMATTALLSVGLTVEVVKQLTGRQRPSAGSTGGNFDGPFSGAKSFPSGHTAVAFSLATVYGRRYSKYEWALDGLAVGVGVARMRGNMHYLGDVVVGAAIGKYFGHRAVRGKGGLFGWRF